MTRSGPPGTELEIVEDELEDIVPPQAEGLSTLIITVVALVLLVLAPFATRPQPADRGWYLAPINWPAITLGMTILAGCVVAWRFLGIYWSASDKVTVRRDALWAFSGMPHALEYAAWFCVYLYAISYLGFAISTLIFLQFVTWRSGLRGWKWVATAFAITVAIVIIFRIGIGLWFPLAPIFRLMPDWITNTVGSVL